MISVLILTLNEAQDLPSALASVSWSDDIVVLDSFSTDQTPSIVGERGARLYQRRFDTYSSQRNAGITGIQYKHPWLLMLDADERVPSELAREMLLAARSAEPEVTIFRMRRKDMMMGRWLKRSSGYPTWFGRLMRLGRVWIEREINEEYHTDGRVAFLKEHLVHFPFSKGIAHWLDRHNRYSSMEAHRLLREIGEPLEITRLLESDPVIRRQAWKRLAYRLPARPMLAFSYLYLLRLGFLDGRAGLCFATLRGLYEYMIVLKMSEIRMRERGIAL